MFKIDKTIIKFNKKLLFMPKFSSFLFITIIIFLLLNFIGYIFLSKYLENNHLKKQEIIFYKLQSETSNLLTKLLYKYDKQKEVLLDKHKEVLKYLENKPLDIPLDEIYEKINEGLPEKPYNIYITDENLIIKNTTYFPDLGFDLSFAKDEIEQRKLTNKIGISAPIFEIYDSKFFSYSDSAIKKGNQILQVSFTYYDLEDDLERVRNIINENFEIESSNTFVAYADGFIADFIFKLSNIKKPTPKEIEEKIQKGKKLLKDISQENYLSSFQEKSNLKNIKYLNVIQESPIFNDAKIIYSIAFDETSYNEYKNNLNIIISLVSLVGIISIYILTKLRYKEKLLSYKDKFIEHSIHEIKTPLSIISINSQLRDKFFGEDKYSIKIEGALRTLENSYEDMTFLHTKEHIDYKIETLDLKEILLDRIKYFEIIAKTQNRVFDIDISNTLFIHISKIELNRLIDNNLSNAIKYSFINSSIKIILKDNILKFISTGKNINNTKNIFKKYSRENSSVGGHGLGLSIVKDICDKYNIKIYVNSKKNKNIFEYHLNCHVADIS